MKWSDVAANPAFQALSFDEQEEARTQYFNEVVAPQVPREEVDAVRGDFFADTQTSLTAPTDTGDETARLAARYKAPETSGLLPISPGILRQRDEDERRRAERRNAAPVPEKIGSVLEDPIAVAQAQERLRQEGKIDPLLNPKFVDELRNELGTLPVESRMVALRQYAENEPSVYGRAAKVILAQEEAVNRKITDENRAQAKGLVNAPRVPAPIGFGPSANRPAFVDATPNFMEKFDGLTAKDKGKIEEMARTLAVTQEDSRRLDSETNKQAVQQVQIDRFVQENPTLGWVYDKYAAETLKGVGNGLKAVTDVFGVGNQASTAMQSVIDGITQRQSSQQKAAEKERGEIMEEYSSGGIIDQLKGAAKAFAVDPAGLMFNTLGIMGPMLVGGSLLAGTKAIQALGARGAALLGKAGSATAAATAGTAVTGAVMGAGFGKSAIYDAVLQLAQAEGYADADAKRIAVKAQSYTQNPDIIALVSIATALGAGTGVEPMLLNMFGRQAAADLVKKGVIKTVAGSLAKEMPLEAFQGGSEKFAANVGANRAGFDVSPMRGVWLNAGLEALAAGTLAGPTGLIASGGRLRDETKQQAAARTLADALRQTEATPGYGADPGVRASLDPNSYDRSLISPTQTARGMADVGPSAPVNFTPNGAPTQQAGLVDIVVPNAPEAPNVSAPGSTGGQADLRGPAGGDQFVGGLDVSGLDAAGTGVLGGGNAGLPAGDARTDVPARGATGQPAPGIALPRVAARATDQDLLARTEAAIAAPENNNAVVEPVEQWFGRKGDGYATQADAAQAVGGRQRMFPTLDWKVEEMPSGKFRLAGYENNVQVPAETSADAPAARGLSAAGATAPAVEAAGVGPAPATAITQPAPALGTTTQAAPSNAGQARQSVVQFTTEITGNDARLLVAGKTEKPGGTDPVRQISAAEGNGRTFRVGSIPLEMFAPNEDGDRYDGTVDIARARDYASRPAETAPPVIATISPRTGLLSIIDGGNRISAARLRGDTAISTIVSLKPQAEQDVDVPAALPITAPSGQPFSTQKTAAVFAQQNGITGYSTVKMGAGWAIKPAETTRGNQSPAIGGAAGQGLAGGLQLGDAAQAGVPAVAGAAAPGAAGDARQLALVQPQSGQPLAAGASEGERAAVVGGPLFASKVKSAPISIIRLAQNSTKRQSGVEFVPVSGGQLNEQQRAASLMATLNGQTVTFIEQTAGDERAMPNGLAVAGKHVMIDVKSEDAPLAVAMHEVVHNMPDRIRKPLEAALRKLFKSGMEGEFKTEFNYDDASLDREIPAMITQAVTKRKDFWNELRQEMGNKDFSAVAELIIKRLDNWVRGVRSEYGDSFIDKYVTDVAQARSLIAKAYAQSMQEQGLTPDTAVAGDVSSSRRVKTEKPIEMARSNKARAEKTDIAKNAEIVNPGFNEQSKELKETLEKAGADVVDVLQIDQLIDSKDIRTITLQDMLGMSIFPTIADRTAAAALYTGIDASGLDLAVPLLGGPFFPLRKSNAQAGVVWANRGDGVISQKAAKLKEGANYMLVLMGDADMHKSNSTVAAAFMGTLDAWARDGRISAENVDALGDLVRGIGAKAVADAQVRLDAADQAVAAAKGKAAIDKAKKERSQAQKAVTTSGYVAGFPGFDDSQLMHAYMDGISFDARKRVLEIMASKAALDLSAPPMQKILDATREPSLAGHRWGDGVLLVEVDQANPQVELGTEGTTAHPDFPVGVRGKVVGKLDAAINWELLWGDWLQENAGKEGPRRAFELSKPIVTVSQELIDRIGPIKQANIDGSRQARLAADFAAGNWRTSAEAVNKGGVSPQEFLDALAMSDAKDTLSSYLLPQLKKDIKAGTKKIYQLGDGQIFFMLETRPDGSKYLASVVNNEKGARGIGAPAVVLKALEEGATDLDAFAVKSDKYPKGFLPSLYSAFGFQVTNKYEFDPQYFKPELSEKERKLALSDAVKYWQSSTPGFNPKNGMPDAVEMKWSGTNEDRAKATERYLRSGLEGLLSGRADADVGNFSAEFRAPDQETADGAGTTADGSRAGGDQGAGAGASVASRARITVQAIADLTDNELANLGLTKQDRAAVRQALGRDDAAGIQRSKRVAGPAEPARGPSARPDAADGISVTGIHYGRAAGLSRLSGASFGSGIKGAEQARLGEAGVDPRIQKRVYFYLTNNNADTPRPEIGLGAHVYRATLGNLYDPSKGSADADRRVKDSMQGSDSNAFESAVLDAGFRGYVNREQGTAVVLNADVPVAYEGLAQFSKMRDRIIQRVQQGPVTRTEGDELVRKPTNDEMMGIIKARSALVAAAPSFKLEFGEARVKKSEASEADRVLAESEAAFQFGERMRSAPAPEDADQVSPSSVVMFSNRAASPADRIKWRKISDVKTEIGLDALPRHIIPFATFMRTMANKAANGGLTSRDLIKAYTIARSSMNRTAVTTSRIKDAGLVLPENFSDAKIRPEGAFGYWLLSPVGQRYLNAAEVAIVDQDAVADAVKVMAPFGTQNALGKDLERAAGGDLHTRLPGMAAAIAKAATGKNAVKDWQDATNNLFGVREAKKGFLGSLLGFGQLPTFDARQINVNVEAGSKEDTLRALSSVKARDVVAKLARRMDALSLTMAPEYAPFYQHLVHHAVWDAVGGTETTHSDVIESMMMASNRVASDRIGVSKLAQQGYVRAEVPRVQAARKMGGILSKLDAGKLTPQEFELQVRVLSSRLADVSATKDANKILNERERGADIVREKLIAARRRGDVDFDTTEFALWALQQNPAIAEGLGISVREQPQNGQDAAGDYNPAAAVMRVFKGAANVGTAVHEILHHTERMMPQTVQIGIRREWSKTYAKALAKANPKQRVALEKMLEAMAGSQVAQGAVRDAFADGTLDYDAHYQLVNPSEFWAVNATSILQSRYEADSWIGKAKQWLSEMVQKAKGLVGMRSNAPVLRGLEAVLSGDGERQSQRMLSEGKVFEDIADPVNDDVETEEPQLSRSNRRQRLSTVGQNFTLPATSRFDDARIKLQDDALRMRRVIEAVKAKGGVVGEAQNFYDANTLMPGRVQATMDDFRDNVMRPLIDKAVAAKIDMDELSLYAYAKHARERNAYIASINPRMPDGGSGMKNADAANILADVAAGPKATEYEDLHRDLMSITSTTRQVMLVEGLITQDEFNALDGSYDFYIPLRGLENVDENTGAMRPGVGRGINVRGGETIKALGRKSQASDLIENVIRDYQRVITRVEKNDVGKVLLDFVLSNPDPDLWGVDVERSKPSLNKATGLVQYTKTIEKGEDTIGVKVGGQQIYIKLADADLARGIRQAWKDETSGLERATLAVSGWWNNWLRNVLTRYNPAFAAINIPRDALWSGTSAALAELGPKGLVRYMANYGKALMASSRQEAGLSGTANSLIGNQSVDQVFQEFRSAGGITGGFYMRSLEDINKDLRNELLLAGAKPNNTFEIIKSLPPYKLATLTARMLEFMGSASENATRFALYQAAKDVGRTPAQAALLAKDGTTNFNRKGEYGGALNNMYLFFNAAVQGNRQLFKVMKSPAVQASMAGVTGVGMMLALYGASAGGEDDDGETYWDKIPSFVKERNPVFMLPPGEPLMEGIERMGKSGR